MKRIIIYQWNVFWHIFHLACVSGYRNNCFGIAKGAAYSSLLSFFPVLTTLTTILVQANAYAVSRTVSRLVFEVVPPGTEIVVMQIFTRRGSQPGLLLPTAILISVWAASGVMLSLMEGFRAAYDIPRGRPFLRQRAVAALLVVASAVPLLAASIGIVLGGRFEGWAMHAAGWIPRGEELKGPFVWLVHFTRMAGSIAFIVLSTSVLYCFGPNPPRKLPGVLPGALLAAWLWWLTTFVFAWYVRNVANYNLLYGSVGAVIALMVWMYVLSVIALIGCEFNAALNRHEAVRRAVRKPVTPL